MKKFLSKKYAENKEVIHSSQTIISGYAMKARRWTNVSEILLGKGFDLTTFCLLTQLFSIIAVLSLQDPSGSHGLALTGSQYSWEPT